MGQEKQVPKVRLVATGVIVAEQERRIQKRDGNVATMYITTLGGRGRTIEVNSIDVVLGAFGDVVNVEVNASYNERERRVAFWYAGQNGQGG